MNEMVKPEADVDAHIEAQDRLADALIWKNTDTGPVIAKNQANAVTMVRLHPDWDGVLAYNVFTREELLTKPIPGSPEDNGMPFPGRPLKDQDYTWALTWFDRNLPGVTKQTVVDAIDAVVLEQRADTLEQYIDKCFQDWDGKSRLDRFFDDYFVARNPSVYTKHLGRIAMMTLVLRAFYPGEFQKMVPILEGEQNIGKSTGLRALCPDEAWFTDQLPKLGSKDVSIALRGKFLVELAELSAMNCAEMEEIKSFVTRQVEQFRPPYGRREVQEPRRCMFWGTTNQDNYLRDETGSTRFYPVEIERVDVAAIKRDRDQLLGEAARLLEAALDDGEQWWEMPAEAVDVLEEVRENKGEDHAWTGVVAKFVDDRDEVTTREILQTGTHKGGLGFKEHTLVDRKPGYAVAGILKKLGWVRAGKCVSGKFKGHARYVLSDTGRAKNARGHHGG